MLLGIVYHGAVFSSLFGRPSTGPTENLLYGISYTLHAFRLPLFFLIAGFLAALVVQKGGARSFASGRMKRIGIPLIVGLVSIVPLTQASIAVASPAAAQPLLRWPPEPLHLWFLWYLAILYVVALAARHAIQRVRFGPRLEIARRWAHGPWWIVPMGLMTVLLLWPMEPWYLETPTSVAPRVDVLAAYGLFFGFGWLLMGHSAPMEHLGRGWGAALPVALVAAVGGSALTLLHLRGEASGTGAHLVAVGLGAVLAWAAIIFLAGLIMWGSRAGDHRVRYVADASFWLYLVHPPILILAIALLDAVGTHPLLTFLGATLVTFPVVLASYGIAVRHTAIGRLLHGPRVRRREAGGEAGEPPRSAAPEERQNRAVARFREAPLPGFEPGFPD